MATAPPSQRSTVGVPPASPSSPPPPSPASVPSSPPSSPPVSEVIDSARIKIGELLDTESRLAAQFLRLAFCDACTYDAKSKSNGPNGSIRLQEDLHKDFSSPTGYIKKIEELKSTSKYLSYADLYQLAGIVALEKAGLPTPNYKIQFEQGRMDSYTPASVKLAFIKGDEKASKVRNLFHDIGFNDREIVALSRAYSFWENYNTDTGKIKFDNSYYKDLQKLHKSQNPTAGLTTNESVPPKTDQMVYYHWKCLIEDKYFLNYVNKYAEDEGAFFKDYAAAHKKLSELGFRQFPEPIISSEKEYDDLKQGIVVAVAMTILIGFLGFFYEIMRT